MASDKVLTATDTNFDNEVLKSPTPVLVDFWAEWCGPCKAIAPTIDELANEYAGKIKVAKLNVDDNQNIPSQFRIRGIPTLLMFKNGQLVDQLTGAHPKQSITAMINKNL